MEKTLVLFGDIIFTENADGTPKEAFIDNLKLHVYFREDDASELADAIISANVFDAYIIPKLYKGTITFNC
jgi:hypothetical protein